MSARQTDVVGRRQFLTASIAAAAGLLTSAARGGAAAQNEPAGGRLLGTVPMGTAGGGRPPLNRLLGSGLDARLFTDLSSLTHDALITPNELFYVRTAFPATLAATRPWTVRVGGLVREPRDVGLETLDGLVEPRGAHLLECAGNSDPENYGLISAARWEGILLTAVLDRAQPATRLPRVLVAGVDDDVHLSRTSVPGASWIFALDDLERAGAFLATRMNGAPLPPDHGSPVRLVVPGWYGCSCIKWVNRIDLVSDDAPATTQMREFALRTHQAGEPTLARDFAPAVIDTAAMPVRVEKWMAAGRVVYRIVGVVWGGSRPTNSLQIRFKAGQPWVPVDDCPLPPSTTMWSLWSHLWRPESPGRYQIVLRLNDPATRTRRLDLFFYVRELDIDQV